MESIDLPNIQPIGPIERSPEQELFSLQAQLQNLQKQLEIDRSYNNDQAVIDTSAKIAAIQRRMAEIVNVNQKSFKDFQPEGMLKGTIFDYIPDMFQVDAFMKDRFGEKGRTLPNQDREMMQGMKPSMSNGDEVNVDKLPEGLKAMYESGPKGREGVENIAAGTDKFAAGDEVVSGLMAAGSTGSDTFVENRSAEMLSLIEKARNAETPEEVQEIFMQMQRLREKENKLNKAAGDEVNMMLMEMESADDEVMPTEASVDEGMMELEGMQPEMQMLDQYVQQVVQMIQAGASEQEVIEMLMQAGLDEEDINAVFQAVLELLQSSMQANPIDDQLAQIS